MGEDLPGSEEVIGTTRQENVAELWKRRCNFVKRRIDTNLMAPSRGEEVAARARARFQDEIHRIDEELAKLGVMS